MVWGAQQERRWGSVSLPCPGSRVKFSLRHTWEALLVQGSGHVAPLFESLEMLPPLKDPEQSLFASSSELCRESSPSRGYGFSWETQRDFRSCNVPSQRQAPSRVLAWWPAPLPAWSPWSSHVVLALHPGACGSSGYLSSSPWRWFALSFLN